MPRCFRSLLVLFLFLAPLAARAEERSFDSAGVRIRYVVEGKGQPVVLVHGFTANVESNWVASGILPALAKQYQVIALDDRGHGKSDKPHDPKAYGMRMIEDVVRLLDHLKLRKAHVVGYSMGSMIAARLLASHPDRLLSVTLGGFGARLPGKSPLGDLEGPLADSLEQGKGFGPLLSALTPPGDPRPSDEQIAMINQDLAQGNDQKALAAVVRSFKEFEVPEAALRANRVPVLVVCGTRDPLKANSDALKGLLANASFLDIQGGNHITTLMQPDLSQQMTAGIRDFLAAHPAAIAPGAVPTGRGDEPTP
jgi:pimeloyl-ACP methyl ester carboxylesterase